MIAKAQIQTVEDKRVISGLRWYALVRWVVTSVKPHFLLACRCRCWSAEVRECQQVKSGK